jgi:hypothetical protein
VLTVAARQKVPGERAGRAGGCSARSVPPNARSWRQSFSSHPALGTGLPPLPSGPTARGIPVQVKVVVTEVSWDGNIRRSPVYVIHAGDRAVLVGEENLIGSLHELVRTILQTSGPSGSEASQ